MNCYDKLTKKQNPPFKVCQLNNVRHKNDDLLRFTNHGNAKSGGSGYDFGSIYLRDLYVTCWQKINTHTEHTTEKGRPLKRKPPFLQIRKVLLFLEVSVVQSFETSTMTSFVTSHFMNSIMDSIEVQLLSTLSDTGLVCASTAFSVHTFLQVGLGVPYAVTQQLSELGSVFSLFPCKALESLSDFRIAFTISLTAHSQIHTNFCAFTHEVSVQVLDHLFVATFSYAYSVLGNKFQSGIIHFLEL